MEPIIKGGETPSTIEKYNPNHDKQTGRFTTATSNVTATDMNDFFNAGVGTLNGFTIGGNDSGLSDEDMKQQTALVKALLSRTSVKNLSTITFKPLDADTIAQCQMYWGVQDPKADYGGTLYLDASKAAVIAKGWSADQTDIAMGKAPWIAASYAKRSDVQKYIVMHEIGHQMMGEHIINNVPQDQWNSPDSPMRGDPKWKSVIHEAAVAGWQPPSEYAKTNYGEMFSECYVIKEIKGTTGNDGVDAYVQDVIDNG